MEYRWEPKVLKVAGENPGETKEIPSPLEGHITFKLLPYAARIRRVKDLQKVINDKGEIIEADHYDRAENVVNLVKQQVTEVALKRVSDGFEINSFATLECDEDGCLIIDQISTFLTAGIRLGKN